MFSLLQKPGAFKGGGGGVHIKHYIQQIMSKNNHATTWDYWEPSPVKWQQIEGKKKNMNH